MNILNPIITGQRLYKLLVHRLLHSKNFNFIKNPYDGFTLTELYGGESAICY